MPSSPFAFGGSIPEVYESKLGPYLFEPYAQYMAGLIRNYEGSMLEIAAGTGRLTQHIAERITGNGQLYASDINPDMLALARQRVNHNNINWLVADATALPFKEASYDGVICQFGYMFVKDKIKAYREAYRVLKPGGQLLFCTWDRVENNITASISRQVVSKFFKEDPPEFYKVPYSMYDPEEIYQQVMEAGFKICTVDKTTLTGTSPSALDIATGFIEGNPIITEISNKDSRIINEIKNEVAERIRKQMGDFPVQSPLNAWIAEAYK